MHKAGKKRPLKECLGENSTFNELRHKRRRFSNIVLLREEENEGRYYAEGESPTTSVPRRILRAGGKRKKPTDLRDTETLPILDKPTEVANVSDENDIINELTQEFKKARLRPVFFTISSFIVQSVDEVGFTMADEPETEVTIHLSLPKHEQGNVKEKEVVKQENVPIQSTDEESTVIVDDQQKYDNSHKASDINNISSFKLKFSVSTDHLGSTKEEL